MEDRIRAEKPNKNPNRWNQGTINSHSVESGHVIVELTDSTEVKVSEAIFELFTSRLESDEVKGCEAWYKLKGK